MRFTRMLTDIQERIEIPRGLAEFRPPSLLVVTRILVGGRKQPWP
jgi:hypothetical protein